MSIHDSSKDRQRRQSELQKKEPRDFTALDQRGPLIIAEIDHSAIARTGEEQLRE